MEAKNVGLSHFSETLALIGRDFLSGPSGQKGGGRLAIEAISHDIGNNVAQGRPMLEPERIGFAERLPDCGVLFGRPAIGPDEYVLE
jgi:hypothetical protein